ncbi:MAG: heavy-metal-associated domain-containing protein [Anaerolineales bacterium]
MPQKTVFIPAISCGHCVNTVQNEVGEIDGVLNVKADEVTKQTIIEWTDPATWQQIEDLLVEIEYPPQEPVNP